MCSHAEVMRDKKQEKTTTRKHGILTVRCSHLVACSLQNTLGKVSGYMITWRDYMKASKQSEGAPWEMELNSCFWGTRICVKVTLGLSNATAQSAHTWADFFLLLFVVTCESNQCPDLFWISHTCFAQVLPPNHTLPLKACLLHCLLPFM